VEGGGVSEKRGLIVAKWCRLLPTSISAFAYFLVALGIYSWVRDFIDTGLIFLPRSLENVFWLLVATGLGFGFIAEGILLVMHRKQFRAVAPSEIRKSDLIKTLINFSLTLFFSCVVYLFVISRQPDLRDPLAFLAISAVVYIATAAFCRNIRYIPLFFVFLRRKHERV
jgi:hypothetical protein